MNESKKVNVADWFKKVESAIEDEQKPEEGEA